MNVFNQRIIYFYQEAYTKYVSISFREIFFFDWTIESFGEIWSSKQFEMEYK